MIEQITECFAGNFFQELPVSDEQDELDVISMGFNTYMEELNDVMVSKDELEIKNKELIKANKDIKLLSKVKDEFLSGMSHEIRTPLNGMIGFTNILINNTNLTEQQNKLLEAIKTSGDILLVIVNDILDISKIESGKMILEENPIHLIEITQLIIDTFSVKINEKKLIVKLETTEVLSNNLLGDSVRISQILINLFSNAIKFTPQNGSITIELKTVKEENQKSTIEFSVIDTGIGIPKDKLDSVFEAFVQTSDDTARKYGGTGLGLSIVQKLLEIHCYHSIYNQF
jgi:signal transduction histidine kinase